MGSNSDIPHAKRTLYLYATAADHLFSGRPGESTLLRAWFSQICRLFSFSHYLSNILQTVCKIEIVDSINTAVLTIDKISMVYNIYSKIWDLLSRDLRNQPRLLYIKRKAIQFRESKDNQDIFCSKSFCNVFRFKKILNSILDVDSETTEWWNLILCRYIVILLNFLNCRWFERFWVWAHIDPFCFFQMQYVIYLKLKKNLVLYVIPKYLQIKSVYWKSANVFSRILSPTAIWLFYIYTSVNNLFIISEKNKKTFCFVEDSCTKTTLMFKKNTVLSDKT